MRYSKFPSFQRKWIRVNRGYSYRPFFKNYHIVVPLVLPMPYKKVLKAIFRYYNCVGLWHWYNEGGDIVRGIKIYGEPHNLKRVNNLVKYLNHLEESIKSFKVKSTKSRANHIKALNGTLNYASKVRHIKSLNRPSPKQQASSTRENTTKEIYNFIKLVSLRNPNIDNTSSELITLKEFYSKEVIKSNFFKHKTLIR